MALASYAAQASYMAVCTAARARATTVGAGLPARMATIIASSQPTTRDRSPTDATARSAAPRSNGVPGPVESTPQATSVATKKKVAPRLVVRNTAIRLGIGKPGSCSKDSSSDDATVEPEPLGTALAEILPTRGQRR